MDLLGDRHVLVERIASVEEAVLFKRAGATLIGAALEPDERFPDGRHVTDDLARRIRDAVGPAGFVGVMPMSDEWRTFHDRLDRVLALEPAWLQVHAWDADARLGQEMREDGLPVIVDGLWLDDSYGNFTDDDDPAAFFMESHACVAPVLPRLTMVEPRGDEVRLWHHLSVLAPQMPEEWRQEMLQLFHVQAVTRAVPVLLDLADLEPRDARDYVAAVPDARGFYARLGPEQGGRRDSIPPERLLAVLDALRG